MNSLVFLRFELGQAKAQLGESFSKTPAASPKGVETESCDTIADQQPVELEPSAQGSETLQDLPKAR
jgi:hypothetical protein